MISLSFRGAPEPESVERRVISWTDTTGARHKQQPREQRPVFRDSYEFGRDLAQRHPFMLEPANRAAFVAALAHNAGIDIREERQRGFTPEQTVERIGQREGWTILLGQRRDVAPVDPDANDLENLPRDEQLRVAAERSLKTLAQMDDDTLYEEIHGSDDESTSEMLRQLEAGEHHYDGHKGE